MGHCGAAARHRPRLDSGGDPVSLNAFIWVSNLKMDLVTGTAFRVLVKLADYASPAGKNAFPRVSTLAEELGCSVRTVQRALAELEQKDIIRRGDQHLTAHIRNGYRPTVYDLNMSEVYAQKLPLEDDDSGVTEMSLSGVTEMSRGDNLRRRGVTTVVAIENQLIKPLKTTTQVLQERAKNFAPGKAPGCGHETVPGDPRNCRIGCRANYHWREANPEQIEVAS